ncbi:putative E3 ubiquitin-protein ligase MARCH10 [Alligator mississippiensis]|uniref:RING-type E3 ubiquitin transferase n=1 Tax=Alligator mississippiensis TaxID=8496 RepID=A0A151PC65_ALLMI|nr:putative E3 ubiquitin-protein ligase MARCH10 [Alligator mississippiensis]
MLGPSYERPWISAVPVTRQTSADEGSGCEQKSAIKSLGNKHESKFPDINKPSVKQKQKSTTSSKKVEKNLLCPNKITPASQKQSFSRGKRENQRGSLGSSDIQNIRKLEDRDKMTSLLQAKTQVTRRFDFGVQKDDSTNPILFQSDFTAYLYTAGIQHDQLSLALLAMSDLHNQNNAMSNITPSHSPSHSKEIKKPSTDPEKLKRLKDSLLEEDSEEEGDQCRICQIAGGSITNPLLEPCSCVGSLQYVHQECLKSWLKAKIKSGADLETVKNCELCKQSLVVELGDFNVSDYYRNHQQSQAHSELMNAAEISSQEKLEQRKIKLTFGLLSFGFKRKFYLPMQA